MAEALIVTEPVGSSSAAIGRAAAAHETTLVVENMHCGGCIRSVEKALLAVPGVVSARANLGARRVAITTASQPSTAQPFIAALEAAGFKAAAAASLTRSNDRTADRDYLKRLGVAGFAAANVMLLSLSVWAGHGSEMPQSQKTLFHWLSALIAVPAVAYAGQPFFRSAWAALSVRRLNMDVPISLGVCLATAMSLYQTVRGSEQVYFDAAVSLLFFLLIGRFLDIMMRTRANSVAQNLLALRSGEATVIDDRRTTVRLALDQVKPGMRILVATGEQVPVDARLDEEAATLDDSLISGESLPRQVRRGEPVYAGTINLGQPFQANATAAADNTLIAELARLMQAAQQSRSRYVRLADRAARLYAPAVHVLGASTFVGWLAFGHGWEPALTAAVAVLIVTCPCALALAVPAVQVVAIGRLMRSGVILKAPDGLERLAEVDHIVLDKTGTLTLPEPRLSTDSAIPDAVLAEGAALALASRHPYARAVVAAARARGLAVTPARDVREIAGAGLVCEGPNGPVRLGSRAFCGGTETADITPALRLSRPGEPLVVLRFEESVRSDAAAVIADLRHAGYGIELLSGDRPGPVAAAARVAGIDTFAALQRPDSKLARLAALTASGRKVLMVGDGLNDAPALAAGHGSLSPSTAADISQTVADAVMQGERLAPLVEVLAVARLARRRSLENFGIAIAYNAVFVPLAVVGLVTPLIAAIAMSASSIAVTANAMRLSLRGKGGGS